MKKLLIAAVMALALAGCAGKMPSLNLSTDVTLNTVQGVQASYGIALSAERTYKSLPLCLTGTKATVLNPCAQRSVVERLQAADRKAVAAIRDMVQFVQKYPQVDATNAIQAAATAVTNLQNIISQNGV
jgi:hypothetical protein